MIVIERRLFSNLEMLLLINSGGKEVQKEDAEVSTLSSIQRSVLQYLEENTHYKNINKTAIGDLLMELSKISLTKAERLQMLNLWPKTILELVITIEECEERFSIEELEHIHKLFNNSALPNLHKETSQYNVGM